MSYKFGALAAIALFAFAAPASAQIVNGLTGPDATNPPAPIGTKAGGLSALSAPGENNAMAGAIRNEETSATCVAARRRASNRRRGPAIWMIRKAVNPTSF